MSTKFSRLLSSLVIALTMVVSQGVIGSVTPVLAKSNTANINHVEAASLGPVVDQSFTSPNNLGASINECCKFIAQTFTAGLSGHLAAVSINIESNSSFPLHVAIHTVTGSGEPSTTILGETTLSFGNPNLSMLISFPQTIDLIAGVQYAIVVNYEGLPPGAGQGQGVWSGAVDDAYTGGGGYASFTDGVSWLKIFEPEGDLHFQTYMVVSEVVDIDIKPGSFPNSVNLKSEGVIPVAILTTDSFDASTVDADTVRFGATGTEASPVHSALSDVDNDGDLDLILHFPVLGTGLAIGDSQAQLTGGTLDGQLIEGSDSINIVNKPVKVKSSVTDLGTLGGSYSFPRGINESGQITGISTTSSGEYHAFFWQNGKMKDLGTLGGSYSEGQFINDQGQVAGILITASGENHPFFWQNGVMTDLGTFGGSYGFPNGLSENGHVIGFSLTSSGEAHAFRWHNGVMNDLGTLGGSYSYAWRVNALGQVIGHSQTAAGESHAFLWQNGVMTDLGTLGGSYTYPSDINDNGQIIGYSQTASGETHGFLWQNGTITDLGTLGGMFSYAQDINNKGQVVGSSQTGTGESHAFLWQNGLMTDLGTPGGSYSYSQAINDQSQVIGGGQTSSGENHAFLWQNGVMTDLGTLGGNYSAAQLINERGQVVGYGPTASGDWHTFLWQKGTMTDLNTLGLLGFIDINNRGQIAGYTITTAGDYHAALLKK